jgi:hypothetical protein
LKNTDKPVPGTPRYLCCLTRLGVLVETEQISRIVLVRVHAHDRRAVGQVDENDVAGQLVGQLCQEDRTNRMKLTLKLGYDSKVSAAAASKRGRTVVDRAIPDLAGVVRVPLVQTDGRTMKLLDIWHSVIVNYNTIFL